MMSRRGWLTAVVCVLVSFAAGCGRGLKHKTLLDAVMAGDTEDVKRHLRSGGCRRVAPVGAKHILSCIACTCVRERRTE